MRKCMLGVKERAERLAALQANPQPLQPDGAPVEPAAAPGEPA